MRRITALLASLGLILTVFPALALAAPRAAQLDTSGDRIAGSWIVTLRAGVDSSAHAPALARQTGGRVGFVYEHALNGFSFKGSDDAAAALLRSPLVARVEADGAVSLVDTTQTNATWGLDRLDDRDLDLDGTYTYAYDGTGVTAYVIDTGIRISHSDFKTGSASRAAYGYDSVDNDLTANDCHGHGTHVAGTVGGTAYGVAKNVNLVAVRVLDCDGSGTWSGVIAGIDWVTANAVKPAVANMSLGGSANSSVDDAVEASITSGVSYAVAAGNGNIVGRAQDACKYSPARAPNAMTIGATDDSDTKASWSNYGDCVDWFAPGVSITSAWSTSDTATRTASGTSMASPHTAGVAALYLDANAGATPGEVRDGLYAATTKGIVLSSRTANNHLLFSRFEPVNGGGTDPTNDPPLVSVSNPSDGETVSGAVTIRVGASDTEDATGTLNVDVAVDGAFVDTTFNTDSNLYELAWDTTALTDGSHTIDARATDSDGNTTNATQVTVTVDNSGGAVDDGSFSVNVSGSSTNEGRTWTAIVTITASDAGGAVNDVDVSGSWADGATGTASCATGEPDPDTGQTVAGACVVKLAGIHKSTGSVSFTVSTVSPIESWDGTLPAKLFVNKP